MALEWMDTLQFMSKRIYVFVRCRLEGLSVLGAVEGGCGRLELGVGLVCLPQDLLGFIAGQALFSCELEGLEA